MFDANFKKLRNPAKAEQGSRKFGGPSYPPPSTRARARTRFTLVYCTCQKHFKGTCGSGDWLHPASISGVAGQRGKLLFSPYTGQLGARIPSLPVRCHKPFIGRTAASLENKSIKARRPPTYPGPKEGFKEGRDEGGRASGSPETFVACAKSAQFGGEGSLLGACFSSWGLHLIGTPSLARNGGDPVLRRQYQLCSLRAFRKPRHRKAARTSGQETLRTRQLPGWGLPGPPPDPPPRTCGVPRLPRAASCSKRCEKVSP
ncbi:uncharacterized protein LOC114679618 [Macaca mulatta]